jgi:hypothetical protein
VAQTRENVTPARVYYSKKTNLKPESGGEVFRALGRRRVAFALGFPHQFAVVVVVEVLPTDTEGCGVDMRFALFDRMGGNKNQLKKRIIIRITLADDRPFSRTVPRAHLAQFLEVDVLALQVARPAPRRWVSQRRQKH